MEYFRAPSQLAVHPDYLQERLNRCPTLFEINCIQNAVGEMTLKNLKDIRDKKGRYITLSLDQVPDSSTLGETIHKMKHHMHQNLRQEPWYKHRINQLFKPRDRNIVEGEDNRNIAPLVKNLDYTSAAFFSQCEKKTGAYMDYKLLKLAFSQHLHKHGFSLPSRNSDKVFIALLEKEGASIYGAPTVVVGLKLRSWITD